MMLGLVLAGLLVPALSRTVTETDCRECRWKTGDWSSCYVPDGCGRGSRERPVWCANSAGETAKEYFCASQEQPPRSKSCYVACRHQMDRLEWKTSDWGPCAVRSADTAEEADGTERSGVMERNVSCVLTTSEGWEEIDAENCLMLGKAPAAASPCSLPLRQECVLTEWSDWTPCCGLSRQRTRSVLVAPHYGAKPCPQLSEWKSCEADEPGCREPESGTRLRVEKWGECKANGGPAVWDGSAEGRADNYFKHWPQVGTQRRAITCLGSQGQELDLGRCTGKRAEGALPIRERACIISQDCAVGEWTDWRVVQEGCIDPSGNEWADVKERRREILRLHEGQGQSCPHLAETKSTTNDLPQCAKKYRWVSSKWSGCTLPGVIGVVVCGGGLQLRNITCVKADTGQPLPSESCKHLQPPPTVQRCEVACPRDCEVSEWGPWGPCRPTSELDSPTDVCAPGTQPKPLSRTGERRRERTVVVAPSALGTGCPSLEEVQPCPHPRCFSWRTGPWSSCYLPARGLKCGQGTRNRQVVCVTHSGDPVPSDFCTELVPEAKETCLLPCPYDCVVSAWSDWTPCSQPCSTSRDMALRSRNRTIIAPPGPGGQACPDPDEMLQVDACNSHGCHGYSWMTLPWQECNATCDQEGVQSREVWCSENRQFVSEDRCATLKKPSETRLCTIDCPAECQVSPWSEWTDCNAHICYPNGSRGEVSVQSRHRVILEGENCGPLVEKRECPVPTNPCPRYSWAVGNWSQCQLAVGVRCGHGLRTRDLWCGRGDESRAELRHCLATGVQPPPSIQRCHADCHSPCQLTEWTSWSPCKQPCAGVKMRTRELIGLSSQHASCQELSLVEKMSCPCSEYFPLPLSDWSTCLTNDSAPCGTGTRYRAIGCFDTRDQIVDPSLCGGSSGLEEEPCLLPCPVDCRLSDWSPWSECSAPCGPGFHNRTRKVVVADSSGGRACGSTLETKVCNTPCELFQWHAGGWTECQLLPADKHLGCGTGDQYRQVKCVDSRNWSEVEESLCDWKQRPADTAGCHVACPGDCVLGPWSDWSPCPKGCEGNALQERTRSLLRSAAASGASCPQPIQTQACILNVTCFTYRWHVTNFSSCMPLGGSPCGEGMNTRAIYCLRSDNRPVADSWCSDNPKPVPSEKWCYNDCPVDCEVAGWSEWNSSQCSCGQSGMSRHAIIGTNPSSTGRVCPNLLQWKPCPAVPCYSWQPGPWTTCQLHSAACGHGLRTREVSCVRGNDNATVEPWHCGGTRRPPTWESCHSPCDTDCQLSTWSEWSRCHADCTKETTGYETRSRAVIRPPQSAGAEPCPDALWETRPCTLQPCYSFDWAVTAAGTLICQRNDGLRVDGGCAGKPKPKSPACQWDRGRCICEDGAVVLQQTACPSENNAVNSSLYYPDDDLSVWMFAMIGIGCCFLIFVTTSAYLLCNSGRKSMGYQSAKQ